MLKNIFKDPLVIYPLLFGNVTIKDEYVGCLEDSIKNIVKEITGFDDMWCMIFAENRLKIYTIKNTNSVYKIVVNEDYDGDVVLIAEVIKEIIDNGIVVLNDYYLSDGLVVTKHGYKEINLEELLDKYGNNYQKFKENIERIAKEIVIGKI